MCFVHRCADCTQGLALPNQRLPLALLPFGARLWAVLLSGLIMNGEIVPTSFFPLTPVLQRGAAETHDR
jgi:hypothetical protein